MPFFIIEYDELMTQPTKSIPCRNCGHANLATAKVCIVCDSPLTYTSRFQKKQTVPTGLLPPTEEEIAEAQQHIEQKYIEKQKQAEIDAEQANQTNLQKTSAKCPDCGYMNRVGDYFCMECGGHLSATQKREESPADVTQRMRVLTVSEIQAEVERMRASESSPTPQPQKPVEKETEEFIYESDIPTGCFQFTDAMFLRFTHLDTGRYTEIAPSQNKPLLLGRSHKSLPIQPDIDLTPFLSEQHGVSRRHALIRLRDLRLEMQDLNSTNGTGINGFRFRPKETHEIRNGDTITLGRVRIKILFMSKDTGPIGKVTDILDGA